MSRIDWLGMALRAYPRAWRERYGSEVFDVSLELREEAGVGERRTALGLLANVPRAWIRELQRLSRRRRLTGVAAALTGLLAVLAALLVPADPAASSTIKVVSGAMAPALKVDEVVQVTKVSPSASLSPGQIVVIRNPPTHACGGGGSKLLVKRVVGLAGQTISLDGGNVVIDHRQLAEPWLASSEKGSTTPGPTGAPYSLERSYRIPAHDDYVLGDNRTDSCDSRYFGPINRSLIVGVVQP